MSKNVIRLMILSLILHVASSYLAVAQEMATVEDDEANICNIQLRRDGNVLIVEYDLNLGKNVSSCKVDMSLSLDGGESFAYRPTDIGQYLSGDVGKVSGSGKKIIYFSLNERMEKVMSDKEMEILLSVYDKKIKKAKSLALLTDSQQKRKWKYLSNVDMCTYIDWDYPHYSLLGLDYIGGLEYKNRYFIGIGVGMSFAFFEHTKMAFPSHRIQLSEGLLNSGYSCHVIEGLHDDSGLNLLHVPLYIHCKGRFLKSKCSPYAALSLGGRFSTAYKQAMFVEPSVGISYKMSRAFQMYLSIGMCLNLNMERYLYYAMPVGRKYYSTHYGDYVSCPYCIYVESDSLCTSTFDHTHIDVFDFISCPIIVRLGFSF